MESCRLEWHNCDVIWLVVISSCLAGLQIKPFFNAINKNGIHRVYDLLQEFDPKKS